MQATELTESVVEGDNGVLNNARCCAFYLHIDRPASTLGKLE